MLNVPKPFLTQQSGLISQINDPYSDQRVYNSEYLLKVKECLNYTNDV
jgi:hypothetical protein